MNKLILIVLSLTCITCYYSQAQHVPLEDALTVARHFISEKKADLNPGKEEFKIKETYLREKNGITVFYVMKFYPEGFVIVSGDQRVTPVLGFSLNSTYMENDLPPALSDWLDNYADQINLAREMGLPARKDIRKLWDDYLNPVPGSKTDLYSPESIEPLIRSVWQQGAKYNSFCPEDPSGPGGHAFAGCVAIALAQVMFYYRHPETGTGSNSYHHNQYDTISADFENTTYRWKEMVNHIQGNPNPAIAELIFHAGVSVDMNYSPNGSGAHTEDCVEALENHFRYDTSLKYHYRADTSISWKDLLYDNLNSLMPVLYRGGSFSSHSFICDGYADTSFFHFNFGWWKGAGNGYYYLDNLTPFNYNFTSQQAAIFNIFPDGEYPLYASGFDTLTSERGTFEDGSGHLDYLGNTDAYWLIAPEANTDGRIMLYFDVFDTEAGVDLLTIYDGETAEAPVLGCFSGNELPDVIISSSKKMLLHFQTDENDNRKGWFAYYTFIEDQFCEEWREIPDTIGWIQDGSGLIYDYMNNTDCKWLIRPQVPEHDSIAGITITVEDFSSRAGEDFLNIYNGPSQSDPLLAEITGTGTSEKIVSTSNRVLLNFITDPENTDRGFTVYFNSYYPDYCQDTNVLTAPTGTFGDGSGEKYYTNYTDCHWLIQPPAAEKIKLTFSEFDVEFGYDWLKVLDPSENPPKELGHFTSDDLPPEIISESGSMLIHFHTDFAINDHGWQASYEISNLDITDLLHENISVRPNPAVEFIAVEIPGSKSNYKYSVYDICGRTVMEGELDRNQIDIRQLNQGIYILRLYNEEKAGTCKFLKR